MKLTLNIYQYTYLSYNIDRYIQKLLTKQRCIITNNLKEINELVTNVLASEKKTIELKREFLPEFLNQNSL